MIELEPEEITELAKRRGMSANMRVDSGIIQDTFIHDAILAPEESVEFGPVESPYADEYRDLFFQASDSDAMYKLYQCQADDGGSYSAWAELTYDAETNRWSSYGQTAKALTKYKVVNTSTDAGYANYLFGFSAEHKITLELGIGLVQAGALVQNIVQTELNNFKHGNISLSFESSQDEVDRVGRILEEVKDKKVYFDVYSGFADHDHLIFRGVLVSGTLSYDPESNKASLSLVDFLEPMRRMKADDYLKDSEGNYLSSRTVDFGVKHILKKAGLLDFSRIKTADIGNIWGLEEFGLHSGPINEIIDFGGYSIFLCVGQISLIPSGYVFVGAKAYLWDKASFSVEGNPVTVRLPDITLTGSHHTLTPMAYEKIITDRYIWIFASASYDDFGYGKGTDWGLLRIEKSTGERTRKIWNEQLQSVYAAVHIGKDENTVQFSWMNPALFAYESEQESFSEAASFNYLQVKDFIFNSAAVGHALICLRTSSSAESFFGYAFCQWKTYGSLILWSKKYSGSIKLGIIATKELVRQYPVGAVSSFLQKGATSYAIIHYTRVTDDALVYELISARGTLKGSTIWSRIDYAINPASEPWVIEGNRQGVLVFTGRNYSFGCRENLYFVKSATPKTLWAYDPVTKSSTEITTTLPSENFSKLHMDNFDGVGSDKLFWSAASYLGALWTKPMTVPSYEILKSMDLFAVLSTLAYGCNFFFGSSCGEVYFTNEQTSASIDLNTSNVFEVLSKTIETELIANSVIVQWNNGANEDTYENADSIASYGTREITLVLPHVAVQADADEIGARYLAKWAQPHTGVEVLAEYLPHMEIIDGASFDLPGIASGDSLHTISIEHNFESRRSKIKAILEDDLGHLIYGVSEYGGV